MKKYRLIERVFETEGNITITEYVIQKRMLWPFHKYYKDLYEENLSCGPKLLSFYDFDLALSQLQMLRNSEKTVIKENVIY